ncbi:hypothetical protein BJX68DRAFT_269392 [Aspergillus pseudodeflectus]|uniref:Uncharacterized protein n=1 Tax=Aspergillus pseudodeflectus TaxID=176178 RepID=A0ABR4JYH9_9EURO
MKRLCFLSLVAASAASISISDPSDVIPESDWAADNAIMANYSVAVEYIQRIAQVGPYMVSGKKKTFQHTTLKTDKNDTSVLVATKGADVSVQNTDIIKFGYYSNLIQSSFYGVNAAVLVANNSRIHLSDVNITTHNGAANVFAYGTDTVAYIDNAWLYSSGPTSHALYAAGNGTVHGKNIHTFSGGNRCSAFSGDTPAGYVYVEDSIAHTTGIGSAIGFAVKHLNFTNVIGYAEQAPVLFTIGEGEAVATNCDLTGGLLGGAVTFSISKDTQAYPFELTLVNTKLKVLGDGPGLWYGSVYANTYVQSSQILAESGILAVANFSTITEAFNFYTGYETSGNIVATADSRVYVEESALSGDLVAYNGSTLGFSFKEHSYWSGRAYIGYGDAELGVSLDKTSIWNVTGNTALKNFTNADTSFSNVKSNGFSITYDRHAPANKALKGKTIKLAGGGTVSPV